MRDPSPSAAAQDDTRLFNTLRLVFPAHRVFPSGATALPIAPHHAFKESARPNARFFIVEFSCCLSRKSFLSLAHTSTNHERSPTRPTHQMGFGNDEGTRRGRETGREV